MKKMLLLVVATSIAGCAQTSGVLKMGPDTYSISVQASTARGGATGARSMALTEANNTCAKQGKEIVVSNISASGPVNLPGVDVTFRCLAVGDPDLQRPVYAPTPTVVIEHRP